MRMLAAAVFLGTAWVGATLGTAAVGAEVDACSAVHRRCVAQCDRSFPAQRDDLSRAGCQTRCSWDGAAGADETRRAIEAADRALPAWRAKTAKERSVVLRKWFDLLIANTEDLAQLMTAEQGKPLGESRGEIAYAASFIEWFAEEGKRIYGDTIPQHKDGNRIIVIKEP